MNPGKITYLLRLIALLLRGRFNLLIKARNERNKQASSRRHLRYTCWCCPRNRSRVKGTVGNSEQGNTRWEQISLHSLAWPCCIRWHTGVVSRNTFSPGTCDRWSPVLPCEACSSLLPAPSSLISAHPPPAGMRPSRPLDVPLKGSRSGLQAEIL